MVVIVLSVMTMSGCGAEPSSPPSPSPEGPLLVSGSGNGGGDDAVVAGEVTFDDGCLLLAGMHVVWPQGTAWDAEAEEVVLSNGDRVAMGDEVMGGGGYPYFDTLSGVIGDKAARIAQDCAGPTREVAFFNAGSDVVRVEDSA